MSTSTASAQATDDIAIAERTNVRCDCGAKPSRAPDTAGRGHMIWVPGGSFLMGSNDFYPEERPVRQESVRGFWMDSHPVTNARFRQFVCATGYITFSERAPDSAAYPDADPALLVPGSLVFRKPRGPPSPRHRNGRGPFRDGGFLRGLRACLQCGHESRKTLRFSARSRAERRAE